MRPIQPKTGEIFLAKLDPIKGSEQGGERPVIIFQNSDLTIFTSTYLCIPLTTNLSLNGLTGTCRIKKGDGGLVSHIVHVMKGVGEHRSSRGHLIIFIPLNMPF